MKKAMILGLCLSLVAGLAIAREATLTRIELDVPSISRTEADCVVGNFDFDNIIGYYGSWYEGYEDYAYQVQRMHQSPCLCVDGWALRNVSMLLALDTDTDTYMQPVLYADNGGVPGAVIYSGPVYHITGVPALNYYEITLPFAGAEMCQIPPNGTFYLGFSFLNDGPVYGLPVTANPLTGKNFNNWGSGWYDLVAQVGFQGNLLIWAEVDCCANGVQTEESTWDAVKQLFR